MSSIIARVVTAFAVMTPTPPPPPEPKIARVTLHLDPQTAADLRLVMGTSFGPWMGVGDKVYNALHDLEAPLPEPSIRVTQVLNFTHAEPVSVSPC